MQAKLDAIREQLRGSLWFVPGGGVVLAVGLAALTLFVDRAVSPGVEWLVFTGSPESARSMLETLAAAIITLTALVFSVTVVALQLASSQFSPRVLRSFLRDRGSQIVLAGFLGTFAFTMLALRAVRGNGDQDSHVPELSVHVALALSGVCLGLFVYYVHHIAQSMQASTIVARVATETVSAIKRLYPRIGDDGVDPVPTPDDDDARVVTAATSGYLQGVSEDQLMEAATGAGVVIKLRPRVGDFVAEDAPLFLVFEPGAGGSGGGSEDDEERDERLRSALALGSTRSLRQDAAFGFRQLVDVAAKALSPGMNDPSTAVQALDRLGQLLQLLAGRSIPSAQRLDDEDNLRLILPRPDWESYVRLAFDEIRHYGEGSIQISRRLLAIIDDLLAAVPEARREALELQRTLTERGVRRGFADASDRSHGRRASAHG